MQPPPPVRVLLIEDNPRDAELMRTALGESKDTVFEVEWVDRLAKGVERLSRGGLDLILTDLQLPDSNGLETLVKIRAQAESVPVVILTSLDDEKLAIQALQKGAEDYLVKGYIQVYRNLLTRSLRYALERRRAERELVRLASFPEQNPDPIIETDMEGMVTYVNPAARLHFPDLFASVVKHPVLWGLKGITETLQREAGPLVREVTYGARVYEQHISCHPESRLVRSYFINITQRKQMEEREKEFANAVATAAVAEQKRAGELDRAYRELKETQAMLVQAEKMAAVGQLASGIAHEVKNPLGIILQCVNYLEPELGKQGGQRAEILQVIREAVKTSDTIIRGLLDFSRPAPLQLKRTPILAVVDAALTLAQAPLAQKKVRIHKEIADDLPPAQLDENQMKQVLINLILNAIHAMPEGGTLTIRSALKTLAEPGAGIGSRAGDAFRLGETVLLCELEDTGTGIPKDVLPKVFNPFFTTKPPGEGVGLGLPICAAVVEAHGGVIHIESEEGRGTKVIITLPLSSPQEDQRHAA